MMTFIPVSMETMATQLFTMQFLRSILEGHKDNMKYNAGTSIYFGQQLVASRSQPGDDDLHGAGSPQLSATFSV
jgi:hypothetical protein